MTTTKQDIQRYGELKYLAGLYSGYQAIEGDVTCRLRRLMKQGAIKKRVTRNEIESFRAVCQASSRELDVTLRELKRLEARMFDGIEDE
jgi:hypothetical protein